MVDKKVEETNKRYLATVALVITISAPMLYALGYLFDKGYLDTYGITGEFFSHNAHEYFFKFFYIFIQVVTGAFGYSFKYFWIFAAYALFLSIIVFLSKTRLRASWNNKIERARGKLKENETFFEILFTSALFLFFLGIGFAFLFLLATLYIIAISPYKMGQEYAQKKIDTFKSCTCQTQHVPLFIAEKKKCSVVYL